MPRHTSPRLAAVMCAGVSLGMACVVESTSNVKLPVLGDATYNSCNAAETLFLRRTHWYGRVVAVSNAYSQCLQQVMQNGVARSDFASGPYRQCNGDPFFGQPIGTQIQKAAGMARNANDFRRRTQPWRFRSIRPGRSYASRSATTRT